jgi:hypothetical protein
MKSHTPVYRWLAILILLVLLLPMTPSSGLLASTKAQTPLITKFEAIPINYRLELQHAQRDFETVPVTEKEEMHLVVEVTEEPECYSTPYVCVMVSFLIVEYILPRPEYCDSDPYPGDPDEIVWRPDQENVETPLQVGDIVEVYGECWLDLGIYPAVSIPPGAPYFLKKRKLVFLPLVRNGQH